MVIVYEPCVPAVTVTGPWVEETVKSVTVTVMVVDWERSPTVATIVIVYTPEAVGLKLSVEVVTLPLNNISVAGVRVGVGPVGETVAERFRVAAKLYTLDSAIVVVPCEPV